MVKQTGDEPMEENGKEPKPEEGERPGTFRLSFDDMKRFTKVPDLRAVIFASPEELGIDYEEAKLPKGSTFGVVFRPFKPGENADIREAVKDFPEEVWLQELHDEMILRCVEEPAIPATAEGRKYLQKWLPGFRQTLATAIQQQSGMGAHTVRNAKEELAKLQGLTLNTSSISGSVTNIT